MDYARLRLLQLLQEDQGVLTTVASDFTDVAKWLPKSRLLVTYVAGPYPNDEQNQFIRQWLKKVGAGWRCMALVAVGPFKSEKTAHARHGEIEPPHHVGRLLLNHPPVRKFRVDVTDREHMLTQGLSGSFEVVDELYLIEVLDPAKTHVLLND